VSSTNVLYVDIEFELNMSTVFKKYINTHFKDKCIKIYENQQISAYGLGIFSHKFDSLLDKVLKIWKKTNQRGVKTDRNSDVSSFVLTNRKVVKQKISITNSQSKILKTFHCAKK